MQILEWICEVDGCNEQIRKREYCAKHYDQLKRAGKLGGNLCSVDGCNYGIAARGYCASHYSKAKNNGEFNLEKCIVIRCDKQRHNSTHCQAHYNMQRTYGIDPNIYEDMVFIQDSKCAICKIKVKKLVIDHNHDTGLVRGLICNNCNRGIGFLKDNANIVLSAYEYLSNSQPLL